MKVLRVDEEIIANSYWIFPHVFCVFIKLKELPGLKLSCQGYFHAANFTANFTLSKNTDIDWILVYTF